MNGDVTACEIVLFVTVLALLLASVWIHDTLERAQDERTRREEEGRTERRW